MTSKTRIQFMIHWLLPLPSYRWEEYVPFADPQYTEYLIRYAKQYLQHGQDARLSDWLLERQTEFNDRRMRELTQKLLEENSNYHPWTRAHRNLLYEPKEVLTHYGIKRKDEEDTDPTGLRIRWMETDAPYWEFDLLMQLTLSPLKSPL